MHRIDGAGHIGGMFVAEDPAINRPPTEITPDWMNAAQEELAGLVEWAGLALSQADNTQVRQALLSKFILHSELGAYTTWLASGALLPTQNIGPIWHDDYGSLMTWQSFVNNGAAYVGYASVLVGGLVMDTQPTPRVGYVRSGVSNLSRTAYAALRGWARHNGIMVDSGVWAAGTIAVADNPDGTTFRVYDLRGEFLRGWDDGRGVDSGRVCGSWQAATEANVIQTTSGYVGAAWSDTLGSVVLGPTTFPTPTNGGALLLGSQGSVIITRYQTRPRNVALLACIKY